MCIRKRCDFPPEVHTGFSRACLGTINGYTLKAVVSYIHTMYAIANTLGADGVSLSCRHISENPHMGQNETTWIIFLVNDPFFSVRVGQTMKNIEVLVMFWECSFKACRSHLEIWFVGSVRGMFFQVKVSSYAGEWQ